MLCCWTSFYDARDWPFCTVFAIGNDHNPHCQNHIHSDPKIPSSIHAQWSFVNDLTVLSKGHETNRKSTQPVPWKQSKTQSRIQPWWANWFFTLFIISTEMWHLHLSGPRCLLYSLVEVSGYVLSTDIRETSEGAQEVMCQKLHETSDSVGESDNVQCGQTLQKD